ncbi:MAG: permease [Gammaproteobacteria bacterium]|nr:permease [Gammaproteobacteria bacterium]MBQ0840067.1 permease [Gammaproteobacteria bacterium]
MSSCCNKPEPEPTPEAGQPSCSATPVETSCCPSEKNQRDYLLLVSGSIVLICYLLGFWFADADTLPRWLTVMSSGIFELINKMWWGLAAAVVFVGLLERIPRELIMATLGRGGTFKGIARATFAGLLLDLCSHGILMVGTKLYQKGASLGQLMAFLIASPWNSLSLTIIMLTLIGLKWTLLYIGLSLLIGLISGVIFDRLVARGVLNANPATPDASAQQQAPAVWPELKKLFAEARFTPQTIGALLWDGLKDSRMVFRWLFFGLVLATAVRAFVPLDTYSALFGPTIMGLLLTLVAATIIEVCSEGSTPIAADLVIRAGAPGNGFTFLMAGIATDYTEIMILKDLTKSWKIALFLPLVTLPQVLVLGWILNQMPL